jgi:hypothetical protein
VSIRYCALAGCWATELEEDLKRLQRAAAQANQEESNREERSELKAKVAFCHFLAVIACGCSSAPDSVHLRNMERCAGQLCKHMILVCLYFFLIRTGILLYCKHMELFWFGSVHRCGQCATSAGHVFQPVHVGKLNNVRM